MAIGGPKPPGIGNLVPATPDRAGAAQARKVADAARLVEPPATNAAKGGGGSAAAGESFERAAASRLGELLTPRADGVAGPLGTADLELRSLTDALGGFTAAMASRPELLRAIGGAAAEVRRDPAAFLEADGAPKPKELGGLVRRELGGALRGGQEAGFAELGKLPDADIMALAFVVMMEAAKSAREDLKSIMDGVKSINRDKAAWRELTSEAKAAAAGAAGSDEPPAAGAEAEPSAELEPEPPPDGLAHLSQESSLRLQMLMDRMSKADSAASNMLKKFAETAASIVQNLK